MGQPSKILSFVATLLFPCGALPAGEPELPEVLYNSDPHVQAPVWISAAAAVDAAGAIDGQLFPESTRETVEHYFAEPMSGDCYLLEEFYESRVDPPDRSTLDLAVANSVAILLGRVTAAGHGFHFYSPGTLLRIEPSRVLYGEAALAHYYVFFPVGSFIAGPYRICKSDSRYPRAPEVGDELLVMVPDRIRLPNDPFLELEEASSVVVLPADGPPDLPAVFEPEGQPTPIYPSKSDLLAAVERALGQPERER